MQYDIMRPGNTVNFSITLTKGMAETLDRICRTEERNRSELVREAIRSFLKQRKDSPTDDERIVSALSTFSEWPDKALDALPAQTHTRKYSDAQLAAIATRYETDPKYSEIRAEAALWETALVADGLATADTL